MGELIQGTIDGENELRLRVPEYVAEWMRSDSAMAPARTTDPETSKRAAMKMPGRGTQRWLVLEFLGEDNGRWISSDEDIAEFLGLHAGSASKRRGELVEMGLAERGPQDSRTSRGVRCQTWRITDAGLELLRSTP